MSLPTPRLDDRDWDFLVEEAKRRIAAKCPNWTDFNPSDPGMMLVELTAWMTETVLYRLNRIPEKNYIKFLELMGVRLHRARPSRTWVFFQVSDKVEKDELLAGLENLEGVRVSTRPRSNGRPITFTTREKLHLTGLKITKTCSRYSADEPGGIMQDEEVHNLAGATPWETEIFQRPKTDPPRGTAVPHQLYLGDRSLSEFGAESLLAVVFELENPAHAHLLLEWEAWDGGDWQPIHPAEDTTHGFQVSGKITFASLPELKPLPRAALAQGQLGQPDQPQPESAPDCWLRTRLIGATTDELSSIKILDAKRESALKSCSEPPRFAFLATPAPPPPASGNSPAHAPVVLPLLPLEVSRDFHPFGTAPAPETTFYLESPLLRRHGALIRIQFDIKKALPAGGSNGIEIHWEYFAQTQRWEPLGVSNSDGVNSADHKLTDSTRAFTNEGRGYVEFQSPSNLVPTRLGGQQGWFVRARIQAANLTAGSDVIIQSLAMGFTNEERPWASLLTENYSTIEDKRAGHPFAPFWIEPTRDPAFYLCFSGVPKPAGGLYRLFLDVVPQSIEPRRKMSGAAHRIESGSRPTQPGRWLYRPQEAVFRAEEPHFKWEYKTADAWAPLEIVKDGTDSFAHEGMLEFLSPALWRQSEEFNHQGWWLRVRWVLAELLQPPRLRRVALNGVEIEQEESAERVLGSSNGAPDQSFSLHLPIQDSPRIWVRESSTSTAKEVETLTKETKSEVLLEKDGCWVKWTEVRNFFNSGNEDRHFKADLDTGTFLFGNGVKGKAPPPGRENISAAYELTSGSQGNVGGGTITVLESGLPHVQGVINYHPAEGGSDQETIEHAKERGPWELRHGNRAVTREDFIELAKKASPMVGSADCYFADGVVNVIIVPNDLRDKPRPTQRLLREVANYLDARRLINTRVEVRSPDYQSIEVEMNVVLQPQFIGRFSELKPELEQRLRRFVHPISGLDGTGWPIGRALHISELYYQLEGLPGVDHIEGLAIRKRGAAQPENRILIDPWAFPSFSEAIKIDQTLG